jgi:hypothetical protein
VADLILPALANIIATHVPGLGHVYDQTDGDPTPDTLGLVGNLPVVGFVDPYQGDYDTADGDEVGNTWGYGGQTTDRSTILCIVFIGGLQGTKVGTLQRRARPFARYRIKDAIRQHNTLNRTVFKAIARKFEAGPFSWGSADGSANWYVVRVTIDVIDERAVTPGS